MCDESSGRRAVRTLRRYGGGCRPAVRPPPRSEIRRACPCGAGHLRADRRRQHRRRHLPERQEKTMLVSYDTELTLAVSRQRAAELHAGGRPAPPGPGAAARRPGPVVVAAGRLAAPGRPARGALRLHAGPALAMSPPGTVIQASLTLREQRARTPGSREWGWPGAGRGGNRSGIVTPSWHTRTRDRPCVQHRARRPGGRARPAARRPQAGARSGAVGGADRGRGGRRQDPPGGRVHRRCRRRRRPGPHRAVPRAGRGGAAVRAVRRRPARPAPAATGRRRSPATSRSSPGCCPSWRRPLPSGFPRPHRGYLFDLVAGLFAGWRPRAPAGPRRSRTCTGPTGPPAT